MSPQVNTAPPTRRRFLAIASSTLLALLLAPSIRGQATVRRIGFLTGFARADVEANMKLLRQELEKLGWVDGRNIVFLEARAAEGINERLPGLAAELAAQTPDIIVVSSTPATRAAMQATMTVPLVMAGVGNPRSLQFNSIDSTWTSPQS